MNRFLLSAGVAIMVLAFSLACGQPYTSAPPPRLDALRPTSEQLDASTESAAIAARLATDPRDVDALIEMAALELDAVAPNADTLPIARLQLAVELTSDPRRLRNAGIYLARAARSHEAVVAFEKALAANPSDSHILYLAGIISFHSIGDTVRAEQHWVKFLEVEPTGEKAEQVQRALSLIREG